jgi:hypothetical protein
MKDFTTITRLENGTFEMTRTISEIWTAEELKKQLANLEHSKEQALDVLEVSDIRINVLKEALEKGYGEADTRVVPIKSH